jgi:hypothetical protein
MMRSLILEVGTGLGGWMMLDQYKIAAPAI